MIKKGMESTSPKGAATLKRYVELLGAVSRGEVTRLAEAVDVDRRLLQELLAAGLISDNRVDRGVMTVIQALVITPDGVGALTQWSDYLSQKTFRHKLWGFAAQFFWVLLGAAAATLSDLVSLFADCT